MNHANRNEYTFLNRLTSIVEENLGDENFGVSELAKEAGLNRSQLYIKVKSLTKKSASQFIREIRLNKALELLRQTEMNVSEIAFKVGFSSPAYFNNCFHAYFGYPPGEAKKKVVEGLKSNDDSTTSEQIERHVNAQKPGKPVIAIALVVIMAIAFFVIFVNLAKRQMFEGREKSIIVLPFKNLSSDKNNQYFADGISEDILNQLTKINDLKMVSRTSAEQFRESSLSSSEIARHIKVNYLLEGSVRRQGDNVRISVQLIDARQDRHLWSEVYDRQLADIFIIQSDIAKNVAARLQAILSPEEIKQIGKLHPKNAEAYDKYLMGQYLCLKRDSLTIRKGIEYFKQAIAIDSGYTLAYAGLADGYYALAFTGNIERRTGYDLAYKMAEKALDMDSTLAEAYAVMGVVSKFGYWKWEEARKFFKKAIEVDSNCMVAHLYYSSFLDIVGEPEDALKHVNKAIELEPLYHMPYQLKGGIYRNRKKYPESTEAFRRSLELEPGNWPVYYSILLNFLNLNDEDLAFQILKEIFSVQPGFQDYTNRLTPVYESDGINGVLELYLHVSQNDKKSSPINMARLCSTLGLQQEALNYLEKHCREGRGDVPRIIRMPEFDNLHSNPRFQTLADTMNLRPYFPKPAK